MQYTEQKNTSSLLTALYTEPLGLDTVGKLSRLTELPGQLQVTGGDVTKLLCANIKKLDLVGPWCKIISMPILPCFEYIFHVWVTYY